MKVNCTQDSGAVRVSGTHDLVNNYACGLWVNTPDAQYICINKD